VEAPAEPLVAVKDVVHAAGKLMKGPDGSYVKVLEAGREPGGQIKLKLEVKAPPRASDFSGVTNLRVLRINRRRAFIEPNVNLSATDALSRGLSLLDARGQPIDLASGSYQLTENPSAAQTYTLHYQPGKGQDGPVRFVFSGRRPVVIDVPFVLKDVPLP